MNYNTKKMSTIDNKLIAKFMGLDNVNDAFFEHPFKKEGFVHFTDLEYSNSWDWLMPVIREVLTLIDINKLDFDTTAMKYEVLDNDIKQAYKEVLKFINEYYIQNKVDETHQHLREILIKYNNSEYGDCIIDEICNLFEFPMTKEY